MSDESRSPSEILRVEELLDAFEAALKSGLVSQASGLSRQGGGSGPTATFSSELEALVEIYHPRNYESLTPPMRSIRSPRQQQEDETTLHVPVKQEENESTLIPEQIGKYKILGRLGEGAMGIVYRAHHPVLNRDVALKTIRPQNLLSLDDSKRRLAKQDPDGTHVGGGEKRRPAQASERGRDSRCR